MNWPSHMNIHQPNPHEPCGGKETPEKVYLNRRKWLATLGLATVGGAAGYLGWRWYHGTEDEVFTAGRRPQIPSVVQSQFPVARDKRFAYGRPETAEIDAARYTNFYEFSSLKTVWHFIERFQPDPWTIQVDGLCRNPLKLDLDEFCQRFGKSHTERQYRHRCVETWAMAIPWSGVPLAEVIRAADPLETATHVRLVSFHRPDEAGNYKSGFSWPYQEGLTLAEAANELTLLATGMYGHPLLKQHGAPIRLVVPWKYGYKSIKSITRIEFVAQQPSTFWNDAAPREYGFVSNVDPGVPHPRWSQKTEWMLGTGEIYPTQKYNGYGKYVAGLYAKG